MTLSRWLAQRLKLDRTKTALVQELTIKDQPNSARDWALRLKSLPIPVLEVMPLETAISTAGGVRFEDLTEHLMLKSRPGVFCAGEMLDWEAPTGGWLLTACFATGHWAGKHAADWLASA